MFGFLRRRRDEAPVEEFDGPIVEAREIEKTYRSDDVVVYGLR